MPSRSPTIAGMLDRWREALLRDLRVAMPGVIQKYDASTQLADVKPQIQDFFYDEDDSTTNISLPVVTNVKVQWPAGGGYSATMPIGPGDSVTLLIHDRSLDAWLAQGGEQAPGDTRRHALTDAVAIPGLYPSNAAIPGVPTDGAWFGRSGGVGMKVTSSNVQLGGGSASHPVAQGDQLNSAITTLITAIAAAITAMGAAPAAPMLGALAVTAGTAITTALTTFNTAAAAALSTVTETV